MDDVTVTAVLGSAASAWPVPGCGCATCRTAERPVHPQGLLVTSPATGAGVQIDGLPRADLPGGRRLVTRIPVTGDVLAGDVPIAGTFLAAGDTLAVDDLRILALPAGTPDGDVDPHRVVLAIGVPAGSTDAGSTFTVLWAADSGPLPEPTLDALTGADVDAAVLDIRSRGEAPDPLGLAHDLARLRAVSALAPSCDLVAAGLTHAGPAPHRLVARLATWGVRIAPDGSALRPARDLATAGRSRPLGGAWRTLVLGPASSGKSAVAEDLLAAEPHVVYAATGPSPGPDDLAWAARVERHRQRRPAWWQTDESDDLARLITADGPPLLVDSLGTWLTGVLDRAGAWDDALGWSQVVEREVDGVVQAWRQAARPVVVVAEETGWGVIPATAGGRLFREILGELTQRLAEQSERTLLVVAGAAVELGSAR